MRYLRVRTTPEELLFVRSHWSAGLAEASWAVRLEGLVARPVELGLDDLLRLPRHEIEHVMQCAGNGRAHTRPRVTGAQWRIGGVGNGVWAGARLTDVVALAGGLNPGVRFLTATGGEPRPLADEQEPVSRSIPSKRLSERACSPTS